MYYLKKDFDFLGFKKSNKKDKMYSAIIREKKDKQNIKIIDFGHSGYMNFQDKTGLNLYSHLIHNDIKRRERYRKRAAHLVKDEYYSPSYFSYYFLW